jgi:hypothetical protein
MPSNKAVPLQRQPVSGKFPLRDITASYNNQNQSDARRGNAATASSASNYAARINNDERIAKELAPVTHLLRRISNSCGNHADWQKRKSAQLQCTTLMMKSLRQRLIGAYLACGDPSSSTAVCAALLVIPRVDIPVGISISDPASSLQPLPLPSLLPLVEIWCRMLLPQLPATSAAEEVSPPRRPKYDEQRHAVKCLLHVVVSFGAELPPSAVQEITATLPHLEASSDLYCHLDESQVASLSARVRAL